MRVRVAVLVVAFVIGTLAAPPLFAQSPDERSEAVVMEALNHLYLRYPDTFDPIALVNAAILGMAEKIGRPYLLAPVPPATSYYDWFNAQRAIAQKFSGMSRLELEFAATKAMLKALDDSHTYFITPEMAKEIGAWMWGQAGYRGIGVYLEYRENRTYIWRVMPGSPAEQAGLKDFDRILEIDDFTIDGLDAEAAENHAARRIRGPAGTVVRLTIQRAGETRPLVIAVTRRSIIIPVVTYTMLTGKIGYIRIWGFGADVAKKFVAAVNDLKVKGMGALVIDVRHNGGGLVDEMQKILSAILPAKAPVLRAAFKDRSEIIRTSGNSVLDPALPLVVLVDEASASASEITAAAIKEYRRGVVIGSRTRGAAEMSVYLGLPGGAAMSVTIARLRTGMGARLEKIGVLPHLLVELTTADYDAAKDVQLERAVQVLLSRIKP
jgi:carboxyl-terminal processing protease